MGAGTRERHEEDGDPSDRQRLVAYLRRRASSEGEFYFKGKFVADDLELTPSQIGVIMSNLQVPDLEVEQWSYTGATTWRVAPTS